MSDTYCEIHKIKKEVIGGCSAHADNWYCPECDKAKEFERKDRYIVIKKTDLDYLSDSIISDLEFIANEIESVRVLNGKEKFKCVVIEHDWPMFNSTWDAIKKYENYND